MVTNLRTKWIIQTASEKQIFTWFSASSASVSSGEFTLNTGSSRFAILHKIGTYTVGPRSLIHFILSIPWKFNPTFQTHIICAAQAKSNIMNSSNNSVGGSDMITMKKLFICYKGARLPHMFDWGLHNMTSERHLTSAALLLTYICIAW